MVPGMVERDFRAPKSGVTRRSPPRDARWRAASPVGRASRWSSDSAAWPTGRRYSCCRAFDRPGDRSSIPRSAYPDKPEFEERSRNRSRPHLLNEWR